MPLDTVQFNGDCRRYQVKQGSDVTEDDVIAQAMVMRLLYRMEKKSDEEKDTCGSLLASARKESDNTCISSKGK